jgi:hypothetical protein
MPTTTPSLPLPVYPPDSVASYAHTSEGEGVLPHPQQQQPPLAQRAPSGAPSAPSASPSPSHSLAPSDAAAVHRTKKAAAPVSRRSTLASRFPLLRKTSREDRGHLRGNSSSLSASPFLSIGVPRASSSSSRGLFDRSVDELPSDAASIISLSADADTTSLLPSDSSRSATPAVSTPPTPSDSEWANNKLDKVRSAVSSRSVRTADKKMHQTSSRLLRMTDDERPFTRVSLYLFYS